jgi:hypothetical protein
LIRFPGTGKEVQPEPDQAHHKPAEAAAVDQPIDSKPVAQVAPNDPMTIAIFLYVAQLHERHGQASSQVERAESS